MTGENIDMGLLSKYLPKYSFREFHSCKVRAPAEVVMEAVADYRPETDFLFRMMIGLRELPTRLGNMLRDRSGTNLAPFGLQSFILLEKQSDRELVYGLVGRFWRLDFGLVTIPDAQAFLQFNTPSFAKLVLGFSATLQADGTTSLTTETRVYCPDLACQLKFAPYWYLIRPVSGLIRRRTLAVIKKKSESPSHA